MSNMEELAKRITVAIADKIGYSYCVGPDEDGARNWNDSIDVLYQDGEIRRSHAADELHLDIYACVLRELSRSQGIIEGTNAEERKGNSNHTSASMPRGPITIDEIKQEDVVAWLAPEGNGSKSSVLRKVGTVVGIDYNSKTLSVVGNDLTRYYNIPLESVISIN